MDLEVRLLAEDTPADVARGLTAADCLVAAVGGPGVEPSAAHIARLSREPRGAWMKGEGNER